MKPLTLALGFFFLAIICKGQVTRFVPQDFVSIQTALNNSNQGDIILVGPGTYFEHLLWPEYGNGIVLKSTDGAESTIIDGSENGSVLFFEGENSIDQSTIVDGFTIRNGYSNEATSRASGININGVSPLLRNLIVENNVVFTESGRGAGMAFHESSSIIENCLIRNNKIIATQWANGGGVYVEDSNIEFHDCTIASNEISSDSWAYGGGINILESNALLDNCTIEGNTSDGGGWSYGAGIKIIGYGGNVLDVDIINCTITNNRPLGNRPHGSGIHSKFPGELNIINTLIHNNGLSTSTVYVERATTNIFNSTIARNFSGLRCQEANLNIRNSILWDNDYAISISPLGPSDIYVDHSLIQDGYFGVGNIDSDPLFVSEDFFGLSADSPCLNAGSPEIDFNTDILGNERPFPAGSRPDIGAYEVDQLFTHILSRFFLDSNTNGIHDVDEFYIPKGAIKINDQTIKQNKVANGIFTVVGLGSHNISYHPSDDQLWFLTSTPSEYDFEVNSENFADTISFGINPTREIRKLQPGIYCPPLRCSRTITIECFIANLGTTIENGIMWADLDPRITEVNPDIDADYEDLNKLGWDYTNLLPGEMFSSYISFKVPDVDDIEPGEMLSFLVEAKSSFNPDYIDVFAYQDEVRCAYDPNDKLVNPNREDNLVLRDQDVIYTIRFQNVGNDRADNVYVRDTLDSNFDFSTFNLLSSSHRDKLSYTISTDGILNFDFLNINLPDSTSNEVLSHGFIMYSIRPDSTLVDFSTIENTAHIYFDFNPAIVTNITTNNVVEEFPISSLDEDYLSSNVIVYPNPSDGVIHFSELIDEVALFNMAGKPILVEKSTKMINLRNTNNQLFLVRITLNGQVKYEKIALIK